MPADRVLCRIADLLAREYGGPGAAWDPNDPPLVLEGSTSAMLSIDLRAKIPNRRFASRGHILNIGSDDFTVVLQAVNGASSPLTVKASGPAEPITCNLIGVKITPASGKTAAYQIKAQ